MIEIETGVPLPAGSRGGARWKYPFSEMKVGDSFVCPAKINVASSAAYWAGKRLGMKFTCRAIDANRTRIWRIA